jgi:hypothetical protein
MIKEIFNPQESSVTFNHLNCMKKESKSIILSASDLSGHLACAHLTELNLNALNGIIDYPNFNDQTLDILLERGREFEQSYLENLRREGLNIISAADDGFLSVNQTIAAMQKGADAIYQASLRSSLCRAQASSADIHCNWKIFNG